MTISIDAEGLMGNAITHITPRIVAFDLSLSCTGGCDETGPSRIVPPKHLDDVGRLHWYRSELRQWVDYAALVVIEGYSFASKFVAHQLGELGGVARLVAYDAQVPLVIIPPSSRAMFATGKGNAKKDLVFAEAIRKLGYQGSSNDEADALWLYTMATTHYANSATNDAQRKALAKIAWPGLDAQGIAR